MSNGSAGAASPRRRLSGRALTVAAGLLVVLAMAAAGVDRWYRADLLRNARGRTYAIVEGHASALRLSLTQRSVVVNSLAAWLRDSSPVPLSLRWRLSENLTERFFYPQTGKRFNDFYRPKKSCTDVSR